MLMDQSEFNEVDVVLIDGIIRVKEDERRSRKPGESAVFWWPGDLRAFGGIRPSPPSELEELIEASYGDSQDPLGTTSQAIGECSVSCTQAQNSTAASGLPGGARGPVGLLSARCPPPVNLLTRLVGDLTRRFDAGARQIICAECHRKPKKS